MTGQAAPAPVGMARRRHFLSQPSLDITPAPPPFSALNSSPAGPRVARMAATALSCASKTARLGGAQTSAGSELRPLGEKHRPNGDHRAIARFAAAYSLLRVSPSPNLCLFLKLTWPGFKPGSFLPGYRPALGHGSARVGGALNGRRSLGKSKQSLPRSDGAQNYA